MEFQDTSTRAESSQCHVISLLSLVFLNFALHGNVVVQPHTGQNQQHSVKSHRLKMTIGMLANLFTNKKELTILFESGHISNQCIKFSYIHVVHCFGYNN